MKATPRKILTVCLLLAITVSLISVNSGRVFAASTTVAVDGSVAGQANDWGAIAQGSLTHSANVLVVVLVSTRDCCRLSQNSVEGVSIGDTSAVRLPGSMIRLVAPDKYGGCLAGEMCQNEVWYAYVTSAGTDTVEVDWAQNNLEWMGFIAVSFTNADPVHPIESVVTGYSENIGSVSVRVPAGTPNRLIVQFAYFDHRLYTDGTNSSTARIQAKTGQNLVTYFTNEDTIAATAGPANRGNAVTVTIGNNMLWHPFWETIAFAIRQASS